MGEAAPCLTRSISQPFFASCEYKEGDLQRALTTSISFGRFMNEPLDWEKWSSFSHNRTLEDVQKHSRPGAVAEKKAFFEAHYKKIASKRAAKSPQKENEPPNYQSPQTNITAIISPPKSNTHSAINETQENESSTPVTTNPAFSHIKEQEVAPCKDACSPSTNLVNAQFGNCNDDVASSGQVEQEKGSTENVSLENHESSHVDKDKKTEMKDDISGEKNPEILSSKSFSKNGVRKLQSSQKAPTLPIGHKKVTTEVTEKKRSTLKSIHMSMNGILKTLSKPKERLIHQPLNPKVSVNGVKKNSQVLPLSENKSNSNVSSVCTKKPRSSSSSSTVPSSFSFRSEERAAKRKEFFQKLEEKGNTKEAQKIHLQPTSSKVKNENKKLRRSTILEPKPCTNVTKSLKVPPTQPCSPKLGRKSTLRSIQESCSQPSSKPKNFIEINKKMLTTSMASLPIKKMSKK